MLRLAPSHPPLWRTATTVQFGTDDVARLTDVTPWQERMLASLADGIPAGLLIPLALTLGAREPEAVRFAECVRPALVTDEPALKVIVELPDELDPAVETAIEHGLAAGGLDIAAMRRWPAPSPDLPVIIVAHRLVDPRRAARLTGDDVPHLPIELTGDRATVGPLVVPGRTACLACLHAHRSDRDPSWPLLAAQLLGRTPPDHDPGIVVEAGLLAGRLLRRGSDVSATSISLAADEVRRTWRAHRPHARCLCRSPEGNETAGAHDARSIEPSSSREYARPA